MAKRHFLIAGVAAIGIGTGAGAGLWFKPSHLPVGPPPAPVAVVKSPSGVCRAGGVCDVPPSTGSSIPTPNVSARLLDESFAVTFNWKAGEGSRILLVPHHLVASREIASLISAAPAPSIVYLIAPDHFSQGKSAFTSTDRTFATVAGDVFGSSKGAQGLAAEVPSLRLDDAPFTKEHGVGNIVPYIAKAWPGVHVVPIIVRIDASRAEQEAMAAALESRLIADPYALVVSSIDFSHYLPAEVADFHDELALDVIRSLSDQEADRVEIDSPGALGITLKVARDLGLGRVTIHDHTNSLRLMNATIAKESTSHILASFAPGPIEKERTVTMLFLGDMMFDREVAARSVAAKSPEFPFERILGAENRFFHGQDAIIGNLEGPLAATARDSEKTIHFAFTTTTATILKEVGIDAVSQANNHSLDQGRAGATETRRLLAAAGVAAFGDEVHDNATSSLAILDLRGQKVALLGFNTTDNELDEEDALAAITKAKERAGHVVVFMHWGKEYGITPTEAQTSRAHWFIDQGVDAVIGTHPHVVESVETYNGRPIVYSLGNFIFDQDWSKETTFGLVVGLELSDEGSVVRLFPIKIVKSQPELLLGDDRMARLEALAKISDPGLSTQIRSGAINLVHSR